MTPITRGEEVPSNGVGETGGTPNRTGEGRWRHHRIGGRHGGS
ncbi:hypothetical protein ACFQKF_13995 [Halalkalicoccus sp. GCM10025322]